MPPRRAFLVAADDGRALRAATSTTVRRSPTPLGNAAVKTPVKNLLKPEGHPMQRLGLVGFMRG